MPASNGSGRVDGLRFGRYAQHRHWLGRPQIGGMHNNPGRESGLART